MTECFERLKSLIGQAAFEELQQKRVAIFGVGGVGSFCAEALVRSGVLNITLVDQDVVNKTNINRQLPALISTIDRPKVEVLFERFKDISPKAKITPIFKMYNEQTRGEFDFGSYDVVIDAIDSLSCKIDLLVEAYNAHCSVYCSLGAACKIDPTQVRVSSIWRTKGCPLGKLVRSGLRQKDFTGDFKAVYSEEKKPILAEVPESPYPGPLGSFMPVTSMFGAALASQVIQDILKK